MTFCIDARRAARRFRLLPTCVLPFMLAVPHTAAVAADLFADDVFTPTVGDPNPNWNGWASLGGAWNSDTESFGEITVFGPLWQDGDSLFFGEVRGRIFEDDLLAGNAALGIRQMTASGFNLGAWVGLDVFQSQADNTFG